MSDAPDDYIQLERFAYSPHGTFGVLTMPDGWECYTVERPWQLNANKVSCIPEGIYELKQRLSNVVKRSTAGRYTQGWEVTAVPDRTYIMIHPGNTMDDLEGCIAPGKALGMVNDKWAVTSSQATFGELMKRLGVRQSWRLHICQKRADYP